MLVQVTEVTALEILASPTCTGAASVVSVAALVQPGLTWALTRANGRSLGSVTVSLMVLAVSDSVGTRNTSFARPPGWASGDVTVTWADAGPAKVTAATTVSRLTAPAAHARRRAERTDMVERPLERTTRYE